MVSAVRRRRNLSVKLMYHNLLIHLTDYWSKLVKDVVLARLVQRSKQVERYIN